MLTADVVTSGTAASGTAALKQHYLVLKGMLDKLEAAVEFGLGDWPVIPANVTKPQKGELRIHLLLYTVVEWPTQEYDAWKNTWHFFTQQLGWFGPKAEFALGTVGSTLFLSEMPKLKDAIDLVEDLLFDVESAFGVQLGLITPPQPKNEAKEEETGTKKPLLSKWTIIGLIALAAVGGGIIYYYRVASKIEPEPEPTVPRYPAQHRLARSISGWR